MNSRYRRIRIVGKGSFGCCWLVENEAGERCILKQIDVSRMPAKEKEESANEVKVLSKLRHPFIINYRESYVQDGLLCIITDYAEKGDLYKVIHQQKRSGQLLPEGLVLRWFTQISLALKHMHDRHILHRDLKTQNIFLSGSSPGMVKVGDFGIARVLHHTQDCARTAIGTPYYLSPEICQERPYNHKSDIWSLGCVLYELATLQHAFDADSMRGLVMKILKGVPPQVPLAFSAELRALVRETLTKDPHARPSVDEVLRRPVTRAVIRELLREAEVAASGPASSSVASCCTSVGGGGQGLAAAPRALGGAAVCTKEGRSGLHGVPVVAEVQTEEATRARPTWGVADVNMKPPPAPKAPSLGKPLSPELLDNSVHPADPGAPPSVDPVVARRSRTNVELAHAAAELDRVCVPSSPVAVRRPDEQRATRDSKGRGFEQGPCAEQHQRACQPKQDPTFLQEPSPYTREQGLTMPSPTAQHLAALNDHNLARGAHVDQQHAEVRRQQHRRWRCDVQLCAAEAQEARPRQESRQDQGRRPAEGSQPGRDADLHRWRAGIEPHEGAARARSAGCQEEEPMPRASAAGVRCPPADSRPQGEAASTEASDAEGAACGGAKGDALEDDVAGGDGAQLISTLQEGLKLEALRQHDDTGQGEPQGGGPRPGACVPQRFLRPDGRALDLPVTEQDSIASRIEALKVYLEQELGLDDFLAVYRYLNGSTQLEVEHRKWKQPSLDSVVSAKSIDFLPLVHQLIVCEDQCFSL